MKLDRKKFEQWLKSNPPDQIVGINRDNCGCPLARFHVEKSGGWEVVISSNASGFGYRIDRGSGDRRLPDWADAFAFLVDDEAIGKITAKRALEILSKVSA